MSAGIALLAISTCIAQEQSVIGSAGNYFSNAAVSIEYTVGEVVIFTGSSTNNTLTQGFHQTQLSAVGLEELGDEMSILRAFPNPTNGQLNIELPETPDPYKLILLDPQGKVIALSDLKANERRQLDLSGFANGTYFLRLTNSQKDITTNYKIVKTR